MKQNVEQEAGLYRCSQTQKIQMKMDQIFFSDAFKNIQSRAEREPGKAACSLITALTSEPADILTPDGVRPTGAPAWPQCCTFELHCNYQGGRKAVLSGSRTTSPTLRFFSVVLRGKENKSGCRSMICESWDLCGDPSGGKKRMRSSCQKDLN